jgi:hypothetical protein
MKAYIILWKVGTMQWAVEPTLWPTRELAGAQCTLSNYKQPTITHQVCEVEVPEA